MQKKLLSMAVAGALAAPVAAFADVTVYGSVDGGVKNQSKALTTSGDASATAATESVLSVDGQIKKTNRWGLKGSEDLGGGMKANFTLESGFGLDKGDDPAASGATGMFNRRSIVGLSGGAWSVDIGREYTLNFQTQGIYDPLSHDYGGSAGFQGDNTAGTRTSNAVTAKFRFGTGGVGVQFGAGETVNNADADYTAFNADFAFGPVTVGAAMGTRQNGPDDTKTTNVGAAYKMGAFTFRLGMGTEDIDNGNETQKLSGGVQYDFNPNLTGRVSFYDISRDNSAGTEIGTGRTLLVNVEYSLSKNTLVYAVFDRKTLEGTFNAGTVAGASLRDGATGIGAGIVHNF